MAHKKYPFYVVLKDSGLIIAGNEYREDAADTRLDLPIPADRLQVLTAVGVVRKYGQIKWVNPRDEKAMMFSNPGRTKKLPDYMVGLPTVTVEKVIYDTYGSLQKMLYAEDNIQSGDLAALDPVTGRVVMSAGKGAHHMIRVNARGNGYVLARVVERGET
jgi:hypothetical protein